VCVGRGGAAGGMWGVVGVRVEARAGGTGGGWRRGPSIDGQSGAGAEIGIRERDGEVYGVAGLSALFKYWWLQTNKIGVGLWLRGGGGPVGEGVGLC